MSNLEKRISRLEAKIGSGKAWLIEHNGFSTILSDADLNAIDPCWRRMAVPWSGPVANNGMENLAERLKAARLAATDRLMRNLDEAIADEGNKP